MIPRRAVREFLSKPRDDFRGLKTLSDTALRRRAASLAVKPPVWTKLNRDQRVCFVAGAETHRFAFWADTGVGKTFLSFALMRYFAKAGRAQRFLVLVPNKINLEEWEGERDKHCPQMPFVVLRGSSEDKWNTLREDAPLVTVATYAGLARMVSKLTKITEGKRAGETKLMPDRKLVDEIKRTFDGLVMDESSADQAVRYHSTLAFRVCRQMSKNAQAAFALSATPFGRDPTPLWAQMYLVDKGESLGPTLGLFRAAFFNTTENYWGGQEHEFRESMSADLNRLLAHRSIEIEVDQSTLPPVVERRKEIKLSRDAAEYCEMARRAVIEARGNYTETKNAFLRMRQISSGFLGYKDDDTGERAEFVFDENPKLESFSAHVQSVVGKYKMVVFHEFILSGDHIATELEKLGIGYARVGSGASRPVKEERHRFTKDDDCRVFVLSNKAGARGPNLQVAKYLSFYESPVSPETRKQARRRVERQYSEHDKVFVHDFVTLGTYDDRILEFHEQGKDLFDAIIRGEASG